MNKFVTKSFDYVYIDTLSENNLKKLLDKSPTGKFPLLVDGELFLSGTISIAKYVLSNNEDLYALLNGTNIKDQMNNQMWIDYVSFNIWPFYDEIIGQILGNVESNQEIFTMAIPDLMNVLLTINKHLTFRTFLIDHHVSFADIVLAHAVYPYFTLIFDEKLREKIPNVLRWFSYVTNIKEVSGVLGKVRLCHFQQMPYTGTKPVEKQREIHSSKDKQEKTKNKPKDNPEKPKKTENKVSVTVSEPIDSTTKSNTKSKNPLDELPPSPFQLDPFKKEFLNTKQQKEYLQQTFWSNYDPKGYSIWFIHYNKDEDQGKIPFKTINLKSNFLQKLEKFRRYAFSVYGVYGQAPDLEVEGVWMWRGTEIPQEVIKYIY